MAHLWVGTLDSNRTHLVNIAIASYNLLDSYLHLPTEEYKVLKPTRYYNGHMQSHIGWCREDVDATFMSTALHGFRGQLSRKHAITLFDRDTVSRKLVVG